MKREIFYYYPDGNRIKGVIKEFDKQNRLSSETHIDQIGAVFRRIETEYDILGRLSERLVMITGTKSIEKYQLVIYPTDTRLISGRYSHKKTGKKK